MRRTILLCLPLFCCLLSFSQKKDTKSNEKKVATKEVKPAPKVVTSKKEVTKKEEAKKVVSTHVKSTKIEKLSNPNSFIKQPSVGINLFAKDFITAGNLFSLNTKNWDNLLAYGVSLSYHQGITDNFDFGLSLGGCTSKYKVTRPHTGSFYYESPQNPNGEQKLLVDFTAVGVYKFYSDRRLVVPYALLGVGVSFFNFSYVLPTLPIGGGLQFRINDNISLNAQTVLQWGILSKYSKENFNYSLGAVFKLNKPKPIIVKAIEPVITPIVQIKPVIIDSDKDGIPDSLDKCPDFPGIAKYKGCPIPDNDKDGLNDEEDSCVSVPGLIKYHGCPIPDSDNDGINDEEDSCKLVSGILKNRGCPVVDTDKDGIADDEDKCPIVAGVSKLFGCPDVSTRLNELAKSIFFTSNSVTIAPKSIKSLNEVVAILVKYPSIKLEIEGHTDNVGSPIANQKMSQKRADALKKYFQTKGVDASRLYAIGYGKEKPIATNKTPAGRAMNRRVELKAQF